MKPKRKRLYMLGGALLVLAASAALVLTALEENIVFFHSPSDVAAKKVQSGKRFRIGGLVRQGSVKREGNGGTIAFDVTDGAATVRIAYRGILPDLFREGQGIVAQGALRPDGVFVASEVLAKHDENYMPREVADALKNSGYWKQGQVPDGEKGKGSNPSAYGAPGKGMPAKRATE